MKFYAIQPSFYEYLSKHEQILMNMDIIEDKQKEKMFYKMQVMDIKESMESFFQETIYLRGDQITYTDELQQMEQSILVSSYTISFLTINNPFLDILKRKFRYWILLCE